MGEDIHITALSAAEPLTCTTGTIMGTAQPAMLAWPPVSVFLETTSINHIKLKHQRKLCFRMKRRQIWHFSVESMMDSVIIAK